MHWPAARFMSWLLKRYNGAFNRPKIPPSQWLRSCVVWPGMEDSVEPFKYTRTAPQTLMCILHCSWGEFNAVNFWEWHPSSLLDAASYLLPLHPSEHILMPVMKMYGLLNLECMVYWTLSQFFIVQVLRSLNSFSLSFSDILACPRDWYSVLKIKNVILWNSIKRTTVFLFLCW